jgi:hypothetical protein
MLTLVRHLERDSVMRIRRKRFAGVRIDGACRAKRLPWHTGGWPQLQQPSWGHFSHQGSNRKD